MGIGTGSSLNFVSRWYYLWTAVSSVLTCLILGLAIGTKAWDIITYNVAELQRLTPPQGYNISLDNTTDNYFMVTYMNGSVLNNKYAVPIERHGGMWWTCDTIPDYVRASVPETRVFKQCETYVYILPDVTTATTTENVLEMPPRLSRSAVSCAIVAALTIGVGCPIGVISLFRNLVIIVMINGVCFLSAGAYIMFATILMLLRRNHLVTYDNGRPEFLLAARHIDLGYSHILAWSSLVLCIVSGITWIILSLRLRKYRVMTMYS